MMEGWKEVELGSVLRKIIGGGTPSKSVDEYWNGDIFWCSVKDMSDDRFKLSTTEDTISKIGLKNSSSNLIPANTVITATRMGLGRAFINTIEISINQDLKALIPNEKIDNVFLLWTIVANRNKIESLGSGATVKGIKLETLKSIKINLPPIQTQQKIASILSAYDDLIENNLKRIKLLEEMAQQTYEEWFVRMRFPGYEDAVMNEETGLPEGWERVKLETILEANNGKSFKGEYLEYNQLPVYGSNGIIGQSKLFNCENSIIIGRVGAYCGATRFCKGKYWATDNTITIASIDGRMPNYLAYFILKGFNLRNLAGGAAQPLLTQRLIKNLELLAPSKEIATNFNSNTELAFDSILNLQNQNQGLKEARDILLPRLMSGMFEV